MSFGILMISSPPYFGLGSESHQLPLVVAVCVVDVVLVTDVATLEGVVDVVITIVVVVL
jgi:hypothetical protein